MKSLSKIKENYYSDRITKMGLRTYPPYSMQPRVPPTNTIHVCSFCLIGVRNFEVHDAFGIVAMVCSEECFNLWVLKK